MNLEANVMNEMKDAMRAKDEAALRSLRAIKAEIIKAKTEPGANGQITEDTEVKMLQRMVKQRRESFEIYTQQNRTDLAIKEQEELNIIEKFLPKPFTSAELKEAVAKVISETSAGSPADMGKVMGIATKQLAGKADGKAIAATVKELLAK